MENNAITFEELEDAVLNQLKSQKYMDSTLIVCQRTYNRIHLFLKQHGADVYTHELGKGFLDDSNVRKSTLVAYTCAVRRLDDYIDGKPYRCHHGTSRNETPVVFSNVLTKYLKECEADGNKPATILAKERTCVSFLNFLEREEVSDLLQLNTDMVMHALLTLAR